MDKEICICAAVKSDNEDRTIFRGHRHSDCMRTIERRGLRILKEYGAQGFITSKNRFVTREEGRALQDAAGIKSCQVGGYVTDTLFSEDLY